MGQGWIRGFANAYFDYDPAGRDWTDDNDELYYLELNEAYLTVDTERVDFIFGKKMMRWGTGDGINPMDLINPRDLYQGVIGIDCNFFTNLYLNLQFFYDFIENSREAIALKRKTHGLTFEISDKFLDDDLNAGFRGMYFTSNEGSALEIFAEYKIGDNWTIAPGCMFFNGPKESRLGQYGENDMIYLRLRYSF